MFESRSWKIDTDNLWWNQNRIAARDAILFHFQKGGGPAHLTGNKGGGKTTLALHLARRLSTSIIRMDGDGRDLEQDFSAPVVIIDEAQKISREERQSIRSKNKHVLMVSVTDLTEDGYELVCKVNPLTYDEVVSYINHQKALEYFETEAMQELYKASKGHMRLINTLCRTAIEKYDVFITRAMIEEVAKKKFKLRY